MKTVAIFSLKGCTKTNYKGIISLSSSLKQMSLGLLTGSGWACFRIDDRVRLILAVTLA